MFDARACAISASSTWSTAPGSGPRRYRRQPLDQRRRRRAPCEPGASSSVASGSRGSSRTSPLAAPRRTARSSVAPRRSTQWISTGAARGCPGASAEGMMTLEPDANDEPHLDRSLTIAASNLARAARCRCAFDRPHADRRRARPWPCPGSSRWPPIVPVLPADRADGLQPFVRWLTPWPQPMTSPPNRDNRDLARLQVPEDPQANQVSGGLRSSRRSAISLPICS